MSSDWWDAEGLPVSGNTFFVVDPDAPGGLRALTSSESADLRDSVGGARWEPPSRVDAVRDDVPLGRLSDDDLGRVAELARIERDFDGDDPEGAATVARAADAEIARREDERARAADALHELLDRAQELQAIAHAGSTADASDARRELQDLDAAVADRTRDADVESLGGQVSEYVALMMEDYSPEVEAEARARREQIREALTPERREPTEAERPAPSAEAMRGRGDRARESDTDEHERSYEDLGRPGAIAEALNPERPEPEIADEELEA